MKESTKKANELIEKFTFVCRECDYNEKAKECAIVFVDEILKIYDAKWTKLDFWTDEINGAISFWQEVRQEIINYK